MEHTLVGFVGMLGLGFICIATLVLFALHAIESWRARPMEIDSLGSVDAVNIRVHHRPLAKLPRADVHNEEPTRRAA